VIASSRALTPSIARVVDFFIETSSNSGPPPSAVP
jgi:hypothetical protein